MASQFCMKCGSALPPDAAFCSSCGTPTPSSPVPQSSAPTAPSGTAAGALNATPPTTVGIVAALGLQGRKNFLVQHQVLSLGHSFRVMDTEKRHLFTVQGNAGQNLSGNVLGGLVGGSDSYLGRLAARSANMTYTLVDTNGTGLGAIVKEGGANQSTFTLTDSSGQRLFVVTLQRGVMGGITATAVGSDGRPMLQTGGNLVRHNFTIKDTAGSELAKVHEAWVAVRDTYNVDVMGSIDPLYPLVFTILIDFEKVK
jgi:uncharacterized protein YxjI